MRRLILQTRKAERFNSMSQTRVITIDCETLPAKDELARLCPASVSPVALDEASDEQRLTIEERCKQSALDGASGRLLCIGFIDERGTQKPLRGVCGWSHQANSFESNEAVLLADFWELMRGFRVERDRIVGHNVLGFDLPFIYQRSIICGVRPSVDLPFNRYRNQPVYDTMCEWTKWDFRRKISLDTLARALNLPSPKTADATGARVAHLYGEGSFQAIRDYCLRDVETTREIYRRLTFAHRPPACAPSLRIGFHHAATTSPTVAFASEPAKYLTASPVEH